MLYNGVFGWHGNTCNVILIGVFFCTINSIGPINVCTDFEINRYKLANLENMQKLHGFYLVSRDAKTISRKS